MGGLVWLLMQFPICVTRGKVSRASQSGVKDATAGVPARWPLHRWIS
jgi:hypothetical protein